MNYLGAAFCGIALAIGQVLFKLCANAYRDGGSVFRPDVLMTFFGASSFYALVTVFWIWLLSRDELGRLYPFMALAFITVPVLSHFILGENFSLRYYLGTLLIIAGITLTVWRDRTWQ